MLGASRKIDNSETNGFLRLVPGEAGYRVQDRVGLGLALAGYIRRLELSVVSFRTLFGQVQVG